jgi:hypothetical protein
VEGVSTWMRVESADVSMSDGRAGSGGISPERAQ